MTNHPYDDQYTPEPLPEQETPPADSGEEFDISSFDFTIADPGEIAEFSELADREASLPEEDSERSETDLESPKKPTFSFRKFSATVTEKVTKLMEESPKEPKEPKKPKEPKEHKFPIKATWFPKKTKNSEPGLASTLIDSAKLDPAPKPEEGERIHFTGGTFRQVSKRWLRYALRPGTLCDGVSERLWPLFLAGVMAFFFGFYLLLGLDWYFAGLVSPGRLWAIAAVGPLVGGAAAMAFAAGTLALSVFGRKERIRPFRVMSGVAGACVYPGFLMLLGLLIQLIFRASVSMSFGMTALLWFCYLLLDVLRELFGEKHLFKSVVLLVVWGFVLFAVMTLTFSLK